MSERNPKIEPRPGDVLRKGRTTRKVTQLLDEGCIVEYEYVKPSGGSGSCWILDWRFWARTAEVVARLEKESA